MNPRIPKISVLLFFLMLLTATAGADPNGTALRTKPAGIIKTLTGNVYLHRNETRIKAEPDMPILERDMLITKKNAHAGIVFTDGTVITIGPESIFEMAAFVFKPDENQYDFSFYMEKGTAIYNSGEIGRISPQSVKVRTPKATIGIRGTRFVVDL